MCMNFSESMKRARKKQKKEKQKRNIWRMRRKKECVYGRRTEKKWKKGRIEMKKDRSKEGGRKRLNEEREWIKKEKG